MHMHAKEEVELVWFSSLSLHLRSNKFNIVKVGTQAIVHSLQKPIIMYTDKSKSLVVNFDTF